MFREEKKDGEVPKAPVKSTGPARVAHPTTPVTIPSSIPNYRGHSAPANGQRGSKTKAERDEPYAPRRDCSHLAALAVEPMHRTFGVLLLRAADYPLNPEPVSDEAHLPERHPRLHLSHTVAVIGTAHVGQG